MATKKAIDTSFAGRMAMMRKKAGVTLAELSRETGITEANLEQIEKKQTMPPVSAIISISKALALESGAFLSKTEADTGRKKKAEGFAAREKAYSYKTLSPDAAHKHMKGFVVSIDPESDHPGVEFKHEGEELIYVLEGAVEIRLGQKKQTLRKGQSLHFNSEIVHKLRNPGKKKTELIVVVYTP